ncbi:MAG: DNA polymerase III subunit alpha [Anaerolineae bacterium]
MFTHLQVHSHYTLLGSTAQVSELAARAAADGMSHLALTDTNALYGALAFNRACQPAGVQPVIGMTVTVAGAQPDAAPGQLVLLATGPDGYRSLCRLSSLIQASPEREQLAVSGLSRDTLAEQRAGLLCLSGGRRGWLERHLRAGDDRAARAEARRQAEIYGDRAALALELHRPGDEEIAREIIAIGREVGLPCVAVQPVYTLSPQDSGKLRLLAAIDRNCRLADLPPDEPGIDRHWLTPTDIARRFAAFPEAVSAAGDIAARCGPALPDGRPIWPALKLPANQTPEARLADLAETGLTERYGAATAAIRQRLQRELAAINRHGFAPLFVIVADIVAFARREGVPVSTRGSVANSLVAYCTGITGVDPIAHDLLFERFLNPARANPPDIDLDFCSRRRDKVLEYVRRTYGADRVALVATISTMRPKSAVRETAKVYGLDETAIKRLTALLPRGWHPDPRRREQATVDEIVARVSDAREREVIRQAYGILGQPHHLSVHPGGLVITPGPLTDTVPVQWAPKGFLITQFDHQDVEALGLPKLDLLGISALTVIADAAALVRRRNRRFNPARIPLDDPRTGELLARGDTVGVFQCESEGARKTLRQLKAKSVRDLAVANAFFKPGPATGGMAQQFVRRYRGEAPVTFLHPALTPILTPTKGVLLFQEQILRVATEIAGLSWAQADHLRRGMSKFQPQEMTRMRAAFVAGCQRPTPDGPAFSLRQAETLWEQVVAFSGYGFNQGHATAYADVSYRLAYLKAHWPAELLCARLVNHGGFHHPAIYMAEARRLGIAVKPPHVNHSGRAFRLAGDTVLWMGLGQVRDLRRAAVKAIIDARRERPFAGLRDLLTRVELQPKEATHLIQCGALDSLGDSRAALLAEMAGFGHGSALQLALPFDRPAVPPDTPAQRLAWERFVLGLPVSVTPLDVLAERPAGASPLAELPETGGQPVTVLGYRLPGWTGTTGFYLSDGRTFVLARGSELLKTPPVWQPLEFRGRWQRDAYTGWLQIERLFLLV